MTVTMTMKTMMAIIMRRIKEIIRKVMTITTVKGGRGNRKNVITIARKIMNLIIIIIIMAVTSYNHNNSNSNRSNSNKNANKW